MTEPENFDDELFADLYVTTAKTPFRVVINHQQLQ
jgi:hypothetical protein